MKSRASSRNYWILCAFIILALSLTILSGCGDDDTIVGIVDGADVTWTVEDSEAGELVLHAVDFFDGNNGWAVGDNGTVVHYQSGEWTAQNSGTDISLRGVSFASSSVGWAVGRSGNYIRTTDGGTTWALDSTYIVCLGGSHPIRKNFNSVYFLNENRGWATADEGRLYQWVNDSTCLDTVFSKDTVINNTFDSLFFSWFDTTQLVSVDSIYDTIEFFPDSTHYTEIFDSNFVEIFDTTVTLTIDSIITITGHTVLETQSGFYLVRDNLFQDMWDVHFFDANNGWIVGTLGTIYHTTDGGATWAAQESKTSRTLRSVHFVSASNGWVVGHNGTILHTTNGGADWSRQMDGSGLTDHFVGVSFPDASNGWAITTDGSVYRTADGGANWLVDRAGNNRSLSGVAFLNGTRGWVVGFDGMIFRAQPTD